MLMQNGGTQNRNSILYEYAVKFKFAYIFLENGATFKYT